MKKFCRECGQELKDDSLFCNNCGAPTLKSDVPKKDTNQNLNQQPQPSRVATRKTPMTKKQKTIWGVAIGVIAVLLIAHFTVSNHFAEASVQKRYDDAMTSGDASKLSKLLVHENGSKISSQEADAFLELVDKHGKNEARYLTNITKNGKFLGIYDKYQVETIDQHTTYDDPVEGLSFTFNDLDISPVDNYDGNKDTVTYGPLAPGIYQVEAEFSGDYGEMQTTDEITLNNSERTDTPLNMDIPISMVEFTINNQDTFDLNKAHLIINDEEVPLKAGDKTHTFGPFLTDGSQTINIVVEMPWGEVTSKEISIDKNNISFDAQLINSDEYENISKSVATFGEEYLQALADESVKPITNSSKELKKTIEEYFDTNLLFSGELTEIEIDKKQFIDQAVNLTPDIEVNLLTNEAYYDVTEEPELEDNNRPMRLTLAYDESDEAWIVTEMTKLSSWQSKEGNDTLEGSKELYKPSKKTIESKKKDDAKTDQQKEKETPKETNVTANDIEGHIHNYTAANIEAINKRDFGYLDPYLTQDGPRRKEADDYIDYLESKGIFEEFHGVSLENVEQLNDSTWRATYIEEINIITPTSSNIRKFRTVINVKMINGQLYVDELISTDQL